MSIFNPADNFNQTGLCIHRGQTVEKMVKIKTLPGLSHHEKRHFMGIPQKLQETENWSVRDKAS